MTAARAAFAGADAAGKAVSMNEIARAAKVGIATLYRHFPSRDELAHAVYQVKLDEVTEKVLAGAGDRDALASLHAWVSGFATFMLATRGMMDTLRSAWQSSDPATTPAAAKIAEVVAGLLARGAEDHSIRGDVDAMDVTVAVLALLSTAPADDPGTRARRLLVLFVDGVAPALEPRPHSRAGKAEKPNP